MYRCRMGPSNTMGVYMEDRIVFLGTKVEALALKERVRRAQAGDQAAAREILDSVASAVDEFYELNEPTETLVR